MQPDDTPAATAADGDAGPAGDRPAAAVRGPELVVAGLLMIFAVGVIIDSIRVGTGWGDDGPRAGYFPFYIGLILLGASGFVFVSTLLRWKALTKTFVMRSEFAGVWAVLWPSVVYVSLMPVTGLYVASTLLIAYFMRRHGRYGWPATLAVAVGVSVIFYLVFERWFLVPLPKGPLENAVGL